MRMIRGVSYFSVALLVFLGSRGRAQESGGFTAGDTYTVELYKLTNTASLILQGSTTARADSNGKLTYSFGGVPTTDQANFLYIMVKNGSGTTVRRTFCVAPASGEENTCGANTLSDLASQGILTILQTAGTDNPIYVAFAAIIIRSPDLSPTVLTALANLASVAIGGNDGFIARLTNLGVTSTQMSNFRQYLVHNSNGRDLRDYFSKFKSAVDASSETASRQHMAQGAGFIGDIFADAAYAAGFDPRWILMANEYAGTVALASVDLSAIPANVMAAIGSGMRAMFTRISTAVSTRDYVGALRELGATGTEVNQATNAFNTLSTDLQNIDATYAPYFHDPVNNVVSNAVETAMQAAYQVAFSNFQANLRASDAQITSLRTTLQSRGATLPPDYGTERDFGGQTRNWTVLKFVAVNWATTIAGALVFSRPTFPVPAVLASLGFPHTFNTGIANLNALMEIEDTVQIVLFLFFDNFGSGPDPSMTVEHAAKQTLMNRLNQIVSGISASGFTLSPNISRAIVRLLMQPDMH